jgi:hypothetical protein
LQEWAHEESRRRERPEMERELRECRSEYEKDGAEVEENRKAFYSSQSRHTPGK